MKDWVVFLGGGDVQRRSIEIARGLDLRVAVVDRNANAVGLGLADLALNTSAVDVQAIYNFLVAHRVQPKVFFGNNDFVLPARAVLSAAFGLYDVQPSVALRLLNKLQFRQDLVAAGLEDSPTLLLGSPGVKEIEFPAIIKPLTGGGSRGVRVVRNLEELPDPLSLDEPYVIEKKLIGYEVGLNAFIDRGGVFHLAGGVRRFFGEEHSVPLGTTTAFDETDLPELLQAYEQYRQICQIYNLVGPVKADFLIDESGVPHALEISPRFHGEVDSAKVIPWGQGLSPVQEYFQYMTTGNWGGQLSLNDYARRGLAAGYCSVFANVAGYIEEIDVGRIAALPEVREIYISRQTGDWASAPPESTRDIVCHVYYCDYDGTAGASGFCARYQRYKNLYHVRSSAQSSKVS